MCVYIYIYIYTTCDRRDNIKKMCDFSSIVVVQKKLFFRRRGSTCESTKTHKKFKVYKFDKKSC